MLIITVNKGRHVGSQTSRFSSKKTYFQAKMATENGSESEYFLCLSSESKRRYKEKISKINDLDPYTLKKNSLLFKKELYPSISYPDIVNYLLFAPSPVSADELKCYKSMDSYNQFICGWVKEVGVKTFEDVPNLSLLVGRVLHSQRLSETPTTTWVISEITGKILSAHCNCMAGLGEACSHIGAVLFYVEASYRLRNSKTVTDDKAYWMFPTACKGATCAEVVDIDFTSPSTLKRKMDKKIEKSGCIDKDCNMQKPDETESLGPNVAEIEKFFEDLSLCPSKPAILSIIPPYDDNYIPSILTDVYPKIMSDLYNAELLNLNYLELCRYCENISIDLINNTEQANVEKLTRKQSSSNNWFMYRAGRITASKLYAVVHTDEYMPSPSLIKAICYPSKYKFKTVATEWGCNHEEVALQQYCSLMEQFHENFEVRKCGLFISTDSPFIAASPDALVNCQCCGEGCVEIKCPYNFRDNFVFETTENKSFFLQSSPNNQTQLKRNHAYFYQVQAQMHCSKTSYCDFYVYTNKDYHIERILPDTILWKKCNEKCEVIFKYTILPELVAKYFSRDIAVSRETTNSNKPVSDCYCNGKENGELFLCHNAMCKYKRFHIACVRLKRKPKKGWLCPDCRKRN